MQRNGRRGVNEYSCTPEEWIKAWKLKDWNTPKIRCVGKYPQITTWINGVKVCHWNGETSPLPAYRKEKVAEILGREGSIGLQVHGGNGWPTGKIAVGGTFESRRSELADSGRPLPSSGYFATRCSVFDGLVNKFASFTLFSVGFTPAARPASP